MALRKKKLFVAVIILVVIVILAMGASEEGKKETRRNTSTPQTNSQTTPKAPPAAVKSKSGRLLGMGVSEGKIGFEKAFPFAQAVGIQVIELPIPWNQVETEMRAYTSGWLSVANAFYPKTGLKIGLSLDPIDTNNLRLPNDLKGKAFNDPEVIERYKALIDFAARELRDSDVIYVSVGNEIDVYLGSSDKRWQEYADFFAAVIPHVKAKFPRASVGSEVSFDGFIYHPAEASRVNAAADIVLVTYYPFKSGTFIMRDPSEIQNDFKRLVDLYPKKKIYFTEIGYPSSTLNGSSESKQAAFVKEAFASWDIYKDNISFLNFQWLHDQSPETIASWKTYYGSSDESFISYLSSLGLRTYEGNDKQAFTVLKDEAKKRGW